LQLGEALFVRHGFAGVRKNRLRRNPAHDPRFGHAVIPLASRSRFHRNVSASNMINAEDQALLNFVDAQLSEHGGNVEIDPGAWLLFAVAAADQTANTLAQSLLAGAPFASDSGVSEDDQWVLYHVDSANRAAAMHWLNDLPHFIRGEIRPVAPTYRALIQDIINSNMPHRLAQKLAEDHAAGIVTAGTIRETSVVRALLDRLHQREPLFFSAFQSLLNQHLIDMIVLHQQVIAEDVGLANEIVTGSLSRDPFLQTRQNAAVDIRNQLLRFQIINPLDQQKNLAIPNPYAPYLEVVGAGDQITAPIDGANVNFSRDQFVAAIHAIRRNLYRGQAFSGFDTQVPWMREEIAYPFRFIKQRLDSRRDLAPLDGLYMLERAVEV
jgi:hypothetical protein